MDYEKLYKEALERARDYWETDNDNTLNITAKGTMEYLFPELAESKDERIRKYLLKLANRCPEDSIDFMGEVKKEDILAWLERQKPTAWSEEDERMRDRVKESLNCFIDSLEENTDLEDDTRLSLIGNVKNEIKWVESLRDKTKWELNTEDNKPSIKHSVLMKTVNGVAEGEWQGDDLWYQYRWCSRLKDSDVLAWMELSDLMKE